MKTGKLEKAFAWQISNVLLFALFQLAYFGLLARILSKADFGVVAVANVFVSLAVLVSQIGLGPALIQRKDVSKTHIVTAFYVSVLISILVYFITYTTAGFFARFYEQPILESIIKVLTLSFVFSAMGSTSLSLLQKRIQFNRLFFVEIGAAVTGMSVGVIAALQGAGVWSLVYGTLVLQFTKSVLAWLFSPVNVFMKPGKTEMTELFHFGFGLTLVRLNNFLSLSGLNFILGKLLPMATLGVFERSYRIMGLPQRILGNSIDRVMFPAMSEIQDEKARFKSFYRQNLALILSLTLTASLWLSLYAEAVVLLLLGPKWMDAVLPLQIMFLVIPFRISVRMTDSFVRARGLVYLSAFRKLIFNILLFVMVGIGVGFGLKGVATAILLAGIFQYFNMINLAQIHIGLEKDIYYKPFLQSVPLAVLLLVPSLLMRFMGQNYFRDSQWVTIAEPLVALLVFVLILPLVVKKFPQLVNNRIKQVIYRVLPSVQ